MAKPPRPALAVAATILVVVMAACGGASDQSAPPKTERTTAAATEPDVTTTTPTTTTTTATTTEPPSTTTATTTTTTTTTEPPTTTTTTAPPPPPPPPVPTADNNGLTVNQASTGVWVVTMDQSKLRFNLMPGYEDGNGFIRPTSITDEYRGRAVAAFNGGFKYGVSGGGFFLGGAEPVALQGGAASLVVYKDGTATVGKWGRDVGMNDNVEAVLQNLQLMVDGGAVTDVSNSDASRWGATLGGGAAVPRSGVCVTGDGQVRWTGGPGIGAATLADAMVQAGCVRGMELDINPQWVSFAIFDHPDPANPGSVTSRNLYNGMFYGPDSYFSGKSRNWILLTWK